MSVFNTIFGFEWDSHNRDKNLIAHGVTNEECEETFFDPDKKMLGDEIHSENETRYILIGRTNTGRLLFIAFVLRKNRIRVISARDLNKREQKLYEETT
ncbi:MAG: BrnT family toxin [Candidatus Sungbacteria bacterium]|nr:BrnT family toxin [Candidatus Sungbacteria bacterium]